MAEHKHGTANSYSRNGCRCSKCRLAHAEKARRDRSKRKARLAPESDKHGTPGGYWNYMCRCMRCKAAKAAYNRGEVDWQGRAKFPA